MNLNRLSRVVLSGAIAVAMFCGVRSAKADVRLPHVFSDNMVLQQGANVAVWGWADDGEKVTVSIQGQQATAIASGGKWIVRLKKLKANGEPEVLRVEGKNVIELKNVLVGEVWVCSGQSNMEFMLTNSFHSGPDMESATNRLIRLFHVPRLKLKEPTNDVVDVAWQECTPQTVATFTAVGYYFGRDLQADRKVPVGLIETSYGGSPAETWMREDVLEANPRYKREILDAYSQTEKNYNDALAKYNADKETAKGNGTKFTARAPSQPWRPSELYDGMIAPLLPYTIKGAIWYQGESNAPRAEQYRSLFADMISNWRTDWNDGDFPFILVQLAPFKEIKGEPTESDWAELREAQFLATKKLPKVGIAVITDVGEPKDIHPKQKQPVGSRLALVARRMAYGEKVVDSGPVYKSMKVKGDKIEVTFDHTDGGLEARDGALKGFAVCGDDHKFVWAAAEIKGHGFWAHIEVSSPEVQHPVAVRYGWADCPVVNLWNKAGLPACPFRTDDFPMITAGK